MRYSYSRVDTFKQCPYKFKLAYIDGLTTLPDYDPTDPRIIGTALHTGIEKDTETAIREYYASFPVIDDKHIEEAIKLECVIEKARAILPIGAHETPIEVFKPIHFIGFMDLIVKVGDREYDLYDFKYSNHVDRYMQSGQLHIYKHYFELMHPTKRIRKMYFVFAPKVQIRQKKSETLEQFRARLKAEVESKDVIIKEVEYDPMKVKEFEDAIQLIEQSSEYPKVQSGLCDWCDYQRYCESDGQDTLDINDLKKNQGVDSMELPQNKRRTVDTIDRKRIWLYGAPFSGKTYLANAFPDPLMLNTDGNIRFVDAPYIAIKDIVSVEGRITKRTYAWEVFKDTITELEKKQNDFKTIVVDLVEDTYESCRQYMFNKLGIEHESDSGYGKGWDMIKTEFLTVIKRLMNLDYENIILISHEDTSKDLTKKSGDKITAIKPNLSDKASLKIAGMVDLVARVVNDNGVRTLSFKSNEYVFGGGRLDLKNTSDIPCDYNALCEVYRMANAGHHSEPATAPVETAVNPPVQAETPETPTVTETPKAETPRRRRRTVKQEE